MDRINYRRIFTDIRTNGDNLFIRVTVYCSESYTAPILLEVQTGNKCYDECKTEWLIMGQKQQADAIRYAIHFIDSYDFSMVEA